MNEKVVLNYFLKKVGLKSITQSDIVIGYAILLKHGNPSDFVIADKAITEKWGYSALLRIKNKSEVTLHQIEKGWGDLLAFNCSTLRNFIKQINQIHICN